jgi:hypothetical protein
VTFDDEVVFDAHRLTRNLRTSQPPCLIAVGMCGATSSPGTRAWWAQPHLRKTRKCHNHSRGYSSDWTRLGAWMRASPGRVCTTRGALSG